MIEQTTGEKTDNTWIELSTGDAELFVLFRKYQKTIEMLNKNGVFDIETGKTMLHFQHGKLEKIEITKIYDRTN